MKLSINVSVKARCGFTLVEVMVACALLGVLVLSLFGAFSSGLNVVQSARENLRAMGFVEPDEILASMAIESVAGEIAPIFRVSVKAMQIRLEELKLVSEPPPGHV